MLVQQQNTGPTPPGKNPYTESLFLAVLSPIILIIGLGAGLMGLAYDVARTSPNPLQLFAGALFGIAFFVLLFFGWLLSLCSILLAIYARSKQNPRFARFASMAVYVLAILSAVAWTAGALSIPSTR